MNGFVGETGSTFLRIDAGADNNTVTFNGQVFSTTFVLTGTGTVNFNGGFVSLTGSVVDFAGDGFMTLGATQTLRGAVTNTAGAQTGTLTLGAGSIVDGAVGAASGSREIRLIGGNALITGESNSYGPEDRASRYPTPSRHGHRSMSVPVRRCSANSMVVRRRL